MRKSYLFLLLVAITFQIVVSAQVPGVNFQWVMPPNSAAAITAMAVDTSDYIYITGGFGNANSVTIGGITVNAGSPGSYTPGDCFIFKLNPSGQAKWGRSAVTPNYFTACSGSSISADKNNNIYVAGAYISYPVIFNGDTLPEYPKVSMFLVKYDSAGNQLWIKTAYGDNAVIPNAIAVDGGGNCYVTGTFQGNSAMFGNFFLYDSMYDTTDLFVTKYNPSGEVLWAKTASGDRNSIQALGIATDNADGVYVTGSFQLDTISFGNIRLPVADATSTGGDMFVVKYDSSGNVRWAKNVGGTGEVTGNGIAVSGDGVFITGAFNTAYLSFDSVAVSNLTASDAGPEGDANIDFFLAKYDTAGNVLWVRVGGGTGNDAGWQVAVDLNNNVYVTGLDGTDSSYFSNTVLYAAYASIPGFIATYNGNDGNLRCISSVPFGANQPNFSPLACDKQGNVYIGSNWVLNDSTIFGGDTLPPALSGAAMVGRIVCDTSPAFIPSDARQQTCRLNIFPNPAGNQATVSYTLPEGEHEATLTIFDLTGRKQAEYGLNAPVGQISIQTDLLNCGIYLCSLTTSSKSQTTIKLVVQQ